MPSENVAQMDATMSFDRIVAARRWEKVFWPETFKRDCRRGRMLLAFALLNKMGIPEGEPF